MALFAIDLDQPFSGLGNNGNEGFVSLALLKKDRSIGEGKKRMILSHADIPSGMVLGSALAHNNIARNCLLTSKYLDAQSLAFRLPAVLYFTFTFLVCHGV